jgi:CubicO group peptidase (beta-lactamase class C family)
MRFLAVAAMAACAVLSGCAGLPAVKEAGPIDQAALDRLVTQAMAGTGARGLAVAIVENGSVRLTRAYGVRNAAGDPLTADTIMYGASLTKAAFAFMTLQLLDEGRLDLDQPLAALVPRPLADYSGADDRRAYGNWGDLPDDPRLSLITARNALTHSTGFANFAFLEPDGKLKIHFEPGSRYGYSGEGIMLLQFAIERGLGLSVRDEMDRRVFAPLGMTRTSLVWRDDFAGNLADGFATDGSVEAHDERSRPRAAGSMDTTWGDWRRQLSLVAV